MHINKLEDDQRRKTISNIIEGLEEKIKLNSKSTNDTSLLINGNNIEELRNENFDLTLKLQNVLN